MNKVIDEYSPVESTTTGATGTGIEHNWDEVYRHGGYQTGWVCPICGQVNAPLMPFCTGDHGKAKGAWKDVMTSVYGSWEPGHLMTLKGEVYTSLRCTECGEEFPLLKKTNYCPNCGAKMIDE